MGGLPGVPFDRPFGCFHRDGMKQLRRCRIECTQFLKDGMEAITPRGGMDSSSNMSPDQIATAYHEAGHAVMALALGRPVHRVSVLPNHLHLGHCDFSKGAFRPTKDELERETLILLAGLAAEARRMGRYAWEAAEHDLRCVRSLTRTRAADERQAERLERRLLDKTEHLLNQPGAWTATERIAEELLRKTTISGRAARHLFDQAVVQARA
ncbi:MAG: hypothetical protein WED34_15690 [Planctomycetales bacterium]